MRADSEGMQRIGGFHKGFDITHGVVIVMSKLSKYEQETIINFNVAESDAVVFTRDKAVIRKLDSLVIVSLEGYQPR